ncbi:MAG: OmpA family protein [Bacteroidia bacterium]|nr:OmpA family protein [Bacteroidia bacterium]MDW8235750.1 OmpA family protein [Bacteroidia bacterium]
MRLAVVGLCAWSAGIAQMLESTYRVQVSTVAGSGKVGYRGGPALEALLNRPNGIVVDKAGNIYFSDDENHCVRKVTTDKRVVLVAGSPRSAGFDNGYQEEATFNSPHGLTIDPAGNLYVCDYSNHAIRKISSSGDVSTLAGGSPGFTDGKGKEASFFFPIAIVRDSRGNLWVLEAGNHALRKITPQGQVITVAGTGQAGYKDGMGKTAAFHSPVGLAIDTRDNLYIVDAGNRCIRRVSPDGKVETLVNLSFQGWTLRGDASLGLSFSTTGGHGGGVAVDAEGNLYIADGGQHLVYQINLSTRTVEILAGTGRPGWVDGNGKHASFHEPVEICLGEKPNTFYICDYRNAAIRKIVIEKLEKYRTPPPPAEAESRPPLATLKIRVSDEPSRKPLSEVRIRINPSPSGNPSPLSTNAQGQVQIQLPPGTYTLTAEKEGYAAAQKTINIRQETQEIELLLNAVPTAPPAAIPFRIKIRDEKTLRPIEGARVQLLHSGQVVQAGTSSAEGEYVPTTSGFFEVRVERKGYFPYSDIAEIRPKDSLVVLLKPAVKGAILREHRILFKPSSSQLDPTSYSLLDRIAEFMQANPDVRLRIHGHTDIGDPDTSYNRRLSERRAENVRQYIITKGVDPKRIEAVGHGNTRPIADNNTSEGRALNRRVEFEVIED